MIPKTFKLLGFTVNVRIVPRKEWVDDETVGFWNAETQSIVVVDGLSDQASQQVFCHELVHAILHNMGEVELNANEKFVDIFGSLLHQAWTTCK